MMTGCRKIYEITVYSLGTLIVLFLLFVVIIFLSWSENKTDLSNIAKDAITIPSNKITEDASLKGQLVSITGVAKTDELIGDGLYLKPGKYIAVRRKVEMYAWHTKRGTFASLSWKENPKKYPAIGYENPPKTIESTVNFVTLATIGKYKFFPEQAILPEFTRLKLNKDILDLDDNAVMINEDYIFVKNNPDSTPENPKLGDLRISYYVLYSDFLQGTLLGALYDDLISQYIDEQGNIIYRLSNSEEDPVEKYHEEFSFELWLSRFILFCVTTLALGMGISIYFYFVDLLNIDSSYADKSWLKVLIVAISSMILMAFGIYIVRNISNILTIILMFISSGLFVIFADAIALKFINKLTSKHRSKTKKISPQN